MKASITRNLLLAAALAAATAVAGCGGGGVTVPPPSAPTIEAFLTDISGAEPIETADEGDQVYILAKVPAQTTSAEATILVPEGAPAPPEGTARPLMQGPWPLDANWGRGFTVPTGDVTGTIYIIQVTAQTPSGVLESDPLTLTITGGGAMPCLPVSAWFQGHPADERNITAAAGATVTVLARPFGTATAVQANIQGTPVPSEGSSIQLTTDSWPSPATHGGSFTVPGGALSGTVYAITVVASFETCDGSSPVITVTVQ